MKVTLDLTRLLLDGAITQAEHDRLAQLGHRETGQVFVNILVGFGVVAVSAGTLLLLPSAVVAAGLGAVLMAVGIGLVLAGRVRWGLLANICILVALLFAAASLVAQSALLASLAVLVIFSALGSSTFYSHASYGLAVTQPLATVVLFTVVALGCYALSRVVRGDWERLALAAARTALFLVNLGFWIGSLWGDSLDFLAHPPAAGVPADVFAVVWAVALLGVAVWAARANRRFVVNLAAVFGGIHFYTQWFERLGCGPAERAGWRAAAAGVRPGAVAVQSARRLMQIAQPR